MSVVFWTLAGIAAVLLLISLVNPNSEAVANRRRNVGIGVFLATLFVVLELTVG